jgi:flagellin
LGDTVTRVASGTRIVKASDDAASFSISEILRSNARVLRQAGKNANDGVALINVTEGALNEQASILIRLRELASQAATDTIDGSARDTIQLEFNALKQEFNRIANTTEFNGQKLTDGSLSANAANHVVLALGLNSGQNNLIDLNQTIDLKATTTTSMGIDDAKVSTRDDALDAMNDIIAATTVMSQLRGKVGSVQERLVRASSNIESTALGLVQADSTLRDADMGAEFAELTKNQLLVSTGSAMVGQSNLIPRSVLQLLR